MKTNRHVISYVLFALAVVLLLLLGLVAKDWLTAVLVAAAGVLAGLFFYRRGK